MTEPSTDIELIELAIEWEESARDFYSKVADALTATHPDMANFWKQMAIDESSHASILRASLAGMLLQDTSTELSSGTREIVANVRHQLKVAAARPIESLDDAYEIAHMLENSEINSVFHIYGIDTIDDESRASLLSEQMDSHVGRLEAYGGRFSKETRTSVKLTMPEPDEEM